MKKIIVISVLCVSCLILVNAHADMVSTSVSGNKTLLEGHDYPDSKRKISLNRQSIPTIQPIQTISNASRHYGLATGLYVGAQTGYGDPISPQYTRPGYNPINNSGVAWRLIIGYQINKRFAIEGSYLSLKTTRALHQYSPNYEQQVNKRNVIDISGKASYPLDDRINFYGKAGIAYITTIYDLNVIDKNGDTIVTKDDNPTYGVARRKFAPEVSVGIDFKVRPNIVIDTSLTHIHPVGNNRPGNINYLAVGVSYIFG